MKTTFLCVTAALAAALLVSATVWEGVTDVAFARDLPWAYSIATNSFPPNTVADITNLENGKKVRVIVIPGIETTGMPATLSRNAADAIGLRHDSTCRIRMTQPLDNASHNTAAGGPSSHYQLGPIDASGSPVLTAENVTAADRPAAAESVPMATRTTITETVTTTRTTTTESMPVAGSIPVANKPPTAESATPAALPAAAENAAPENKSPAAESIIAADDVTATDDVIAADEPAVTEDNVIAADESAVTADDVIAESESTETDNVIAAEKPAVTNNAAAAGGPAGAANQPEPRIAPATLTLIPAEERAPPAREQPAAARSAAPSDVAPNSIVPRNAAPSVASGNTAPMDVAPDSAAPGSIASRDAAPRNAAPNIAPPINQPVETPAAYAPPREFSPFQAPLISALERGKWYVQLGVYSRPDNVEEEINRIGTAYPVAVQNIGTDTSPMFRVLLGPLNQGESGAMLQRVKSIGYPDAFVRHN